MFPAVSSCGPPVFVRTLSSRRVMWISWMMTMSGLAVVAVKVVGMVVWLGFQKLSGQGGQHTVHFHPEGGI